MASSLSSDPFFRAKTLASLPLFPLCLGSVAFTYISVHLHAVAGDAGSSDAALPFSSFSGILWAFGILCASFAKSYSFAFPSESLALDCLVRMFTHATIAFTNSSIASRHMVTFLHGSAFGSTLVQGVWATTLAVDRTTSLFMALMLPTSLIIGVYSAYASFWYPNSATQNQQASFNFMLANTFDVAGFWYCLAITVAHRYFMSGLSTVLEPLVQNMHELDQAVASFRLPAHSPSEKDEEILLKDTEPVDQDTSEHVEFSRSRTAIDLWGVFVGFVQISCLIPAIMELAVPTKPFIFSQAWVLVFVATIPLAFFATIKSNIDVHFPGSISTNLSCLANIAFSMTERHLCWAHLTLWLTICTTLAFYVDAVREVMKAVAAKPRLSNGSRLVIGCARLAMAMALGCLVGSCLSVCLEATLPLGQRSPVTKLSISMLLSSLANLMTAGFNLRTVSIQRKG